MIIMIIAYYYEKRNHHGKTREASVGVEINYHEIKVNKIK